MSVRFAADPSAPLYRIGRFPDPLAFPPRAFAGGGRFDHPDVAFLTRYAAAQRRGAFVETLDAFGPAMADLAAARTLGPGEPDDAMPPAGIIPAAYFRKVLIRVHVHPGQQWLDLRSPEIHQELRSGLARDLVRLGYNRHRDPVHGLPRFILRACRGVWRRLSSTRRSGAVSARCRGSNGGRDGDEA